MVSDKQQTLRAAPLRIGISTRALFNLEEEHAVFVKEGVQAYAKLQRERENTLIDKGAGFQVVERLLRLNEPEKDPYVEVMLLSQNSPDLSLRAFNSIKAYGLAIKTGSFTSGRSLGPFISAWEIDLFLSNEHRDVQAATSCPRSGPRRKRTRCELPWMGMRWSLAQSPMTSSRRVVSQPS
jgi:5'-nucleotidase